MKVFLLLSALLSLNFLLNKKVFKKINSNNWFHGFVCVSVCVFCCCLQVHSMDSMRRILFEPLC